MNWIKDCFKGKTKEVKVIRVEDRGTDPIEDDMLFRRYNELMAMLVERDLKIERLERELLEIK